MIEECPEHDSMVWIGSRLKKLGEVEGVWVNEKGIVAKQKQKSSYLQIIVAFHYLSYEADILPWYWVLPYNWAKGEVAKAYTPNSFLDDGGVEPVFVDKEYLVEIIDHATPIA
jgi:hypothetical protein